MELMEKCGRCGGSGFTEERYPMIVDFPYADPSLMLDRKLSCKFCDGSGYVPTSDGLELLAFLNRFYSREHQHTELMRF